MAGRLAVARVTLREMADSAVTDPILWTSVSARLAVAMGAATVPAQRAARVEPVVARAVVVQALMPAGTPASRAEALHYTSIRQQG